MAIATTEVVKLLQQQLLVAVLMQTPLPGQTQPIHFPDLHFLLQQQEKIVSRENLISEIDTEVRVVYASANDIASRAKQSKQLAFLKFRPAEFQGDRVRLTLELHMGFDDVEPLPLGAVTAMFAEVPGVGWRAIEPPAALGY